MKITRKQLRTLIAEMARTSMKDPRKDLDLDPEQMEKLQSLLDSGDEDTIAQVDAIADAVGGSPYHSKLMGRYGVESIMNEFEFAEPYLSTDQLKHLMQAKGKVLQIGRNQFGTVGFQEAGSSPQVNFIVDPQELHEMIAQTAAKSPPPGAPFGGKVLASDYSKKKTGTDVHIDTFWDYYPTLLKFFEAIIKISAKTYVDEYHAAGYGLGEYGHTADGSYRLNSPFSELQDYGKLFLGLHHSRF